MKQILFLISIAFVVSANCQITKDTDFNSISFSTMTNKDTTKWKDTVAVVLLVCDTSNIPSSVYWLKAYSVRNAEYQLVDVSVNPNTSIYVGDLAYSTTLLGWSPVLKNKPVYTHFIYLDDKKQPLNSNLIVKQL